MNHARLAIPLHGKMAARSLHTGLFARSLLERRLDPLYFIGPQYSNTGLLDNQRYFLLDTDFYGSFINRNWLLQNLMELRRFAVRTETTDLNLRIQLDGILFAAENLSRVWLRAARMDLLRRIPGLGEAAVWIESCFYRTSVHTATLKSQDIRAALIPGLGSDGFQQEGFFAREAQALKIPVISTISNYDNIVSRGLRGFMPDRLAVWSRLMADEAIKFQGIPAARIEITGPVQYDRYLSPLPLSREKFLRAKGLDPAKPTICYAGGVDVVSYFEVFRILKEAFLDNRRCNLVFRAYPHPKVLNSPEWPFLENQMLQTEGVYVSNPLRFSSDQLAGEFFKSVLQGGAEQDELACLFKYSDVLVNHFSTVSLEASICDLPVVHMGYDPYSFGLKPWFTAAYGRRHTHNRRKLRLMAAKIAENSAQLSEYIELYLSDRSTDQEARRDYALLEIGYLDGKAGERLAELIRGVL
jgi:hypothetical protein